MLSRWKLLRMRPKPNIPFHCNLYRMATRSLMLVLPVLLLTACSLFQSGGATYRVELRSVVLKVAEDANDHTPVALDFVVVKAPELLAVLQKTTAAQWFLNKSQFLADHPDQLLSWSLEVVPGTVVEEKNIPFRREKMAGLLLFVGYATEGAHRLRLDGVEHLDLVFGRDTVQLANP